jgi:WD40 repeat protein
MMLVVATLSAQEVPGQPVARLDAGDFRALAVSPGGRWLMVADAANDQLRVYDLFAQNDEALFASSPLDGNPVDVAATPDFAIVAVDLGGAGLVQVIAPAPYDPNAAYDTFNYIDLPDRPRSVAVSPDGAWSIVVSAGGYTLLELFSADNINSTFFATPVTDSALTDDQAFLALRNAPVLRAIALETGSQTARTTAEIDLPGAPQRVIVNAGGTLGAVSLQDERIVLFAPRANALIGTFSVDAGVSDIRFLSFENGEWLVVLSADQSTVQLYDVSDPQDIGFLGTPNLESTPVQAIATFNELIFIADRSTVRIYAAQGDGIVGDDADD